MALRSAHLRSSSWWCDVGVATYPTDPPSRDFTKPWGPTSTSEPRPLGRPARAFPRQWVCPPLDSCKMTDWHEKAEDWNCVTRASRCQREWRNWRICRQKVGLLCGNSSTLFWETRWREGWSTQRRNFLWDPNLSVISEQRFLSFLKISISADFTVSPISLKPFWHIFFSCCYGAKGAVNFIFFLSLAFKDAKNWTDPSVLVVSPVPVVFINIVKHCLCLSVIHVHILTHTGARARVKL